MGRLSVETEYDKAVEAVATSITDCHLRKKYGSCQETDCTTCTTYAQQVNCLNNMPDIDKIRVNNTIARQLADRDPPQEEPLTGAAYLMCSAKYWLRAVLEIIAGPIITLLIVAIVLFSMYQCVQGSSLFGQSLEDYDYYKYTLPGEPYAAGKYRKHILDILDKTEKYARDINYDGEINCVDYACIFKILWDKQYEPRNCEIVRNKSGTMNHLFIRVRQYAGTPWECIEPQAALKDINRYFMEDFWPPNVYNPVYNNYEEAEYWYEYARKYFR
jgi:hypothetical protein